MTEDALIRCPKNGDLRRLDSQGCADDNGMPAARPLSKQTADIFSIACARGASDDL